MLVCSFGLCKIVPKIKKIIIIYKLLYKNKTLMEVVTLYFQHYLPTIYEYILMSNFKIKLKMLQKYLSSYF